MSDLSVGEAARALGVDESRVRQLLRNGALPGRRIGRAWLVPAEAVALLVQQRPAGGRPLSPQRAWGLLDVLDGGRAPWLDRYARSKVRAHLRRLVGAEPAVWRDALRARERRHAIEAHRAALARLATSDGVWPAGPAAASQAGADLVAPGAVPEFYVNAGLWPGLVEQLRLREAPRRPDVVVRIPEDLWPFGPSGPGRAAVAASLLDSVEWRAVRAGGEVLNDLGAQILR